MKLIERLKKRFFGFVKKENGAVNLLDVAFAVGIGAALAAVVVPAASSALGSAKANALSDEVKNIRGALGSMMADTGRLPDDPVGVDGVVFNFNGGSDNVDGVSVVGLRSNGTKGTGAGAVPNWNGPYMTSDIVENPFGGQYRIYYGSNMQDGSTIVSVQGVVTTEERNDVIMEITGLPANLQRLLDESMDDGVAHTGWVRIGALDDSDTTSGIIDFADTEGDDFTAEKSLFVTLFPDQELTNFRLGL
ncbi:MAG: hypothetical protein ACUZ8E_02160 [Candidatus Anammoxibacter sp.]